MPVDVARNGARSGYRWRAGSAARARVAQALLALLAGRVAGVARRLLLRFQHPGALFLFGFHRGLLEELGLTRGRRRGLALRLARLAGDANLHQGGMPLREVLLRFRLGAKLFEQGLAGFRGIGLAVQVFGLFLEEAHFNPCCWLGWTGCRSRRCGPVSTSCRIAGSACGFSGRARHLAGVAIARPAARRKPTLAIMANS